MLLYFFETSVLLAIYFCNWNGYRASFSENAVHLFLTDIYYRATPPMLCRSAIWWLFSFLSTFTHAGSFFSISAFRLGLFVDADFSFRVFVFVDRFIFFLFLLNKLLVFTYHYFSIYRFSVKISQTFFYFYRFFNHPFLRFDIYVRLKSILCSFRSMCSATADFVILFQSMSFSCSFIRTFNCSSPVCHKYDRQFFINSPGVCISDKTSEQNWQHELFRKIHR